MSSYVCTHLNSENVCTAWQIVPFFDLFNLTIEQGMAVGWQFFALACLAFVARRIIKILENR